MTMRFSVWFSLDNVITDYYQVLLENMVVGMNYKYRIAIIHM